MTGTLVFLVSIGPGLTFRLFFDGMLRCAGGMGIKTSTVGPFCGGILQARNPKMMRCQQCAWSRDSEEKRNEEKSFNCGGKGRDGCSPDH